MISRSPLTGHRSWLVAAVQVTFKVDAVGARGRCKGSCTCPDHRNRGSVSTCKHQLFVAARVLLLGEYLHEGDGLPMEAFKIALVSTH